LRRRRRAKQNHQKQTGAKASDHLLSFLKANIKALKPGLKPLPERFALRHHPWSTSAQRAIGNTPGTPKATAARASA
jgi:hypothetical protein